MYKPMRVEDRGLGNSMNLHRQPRQDNFILTISELEKLKVFWILIFGFSLDLVFGISNKNIT